MTCQRPMPGLACRISSASSDPIHTTLTCLNPTPSQPHTPLPLTLQASGGCGCAALTCAAAAYKLSMWCSICSAVNVSSNDVPVFCKRGCATDMALARVTQSGKTQEAARRLQATSRGKEAGKWPEYAALACSGKRWWAPSYEPCTSTPRFTPWI